MFLRREDEIIRCAWAIRRLWESSVSEMGTEEKHGSAAMSLSRMMSKSWRFS
jgi:hypothetical protein